MTKFKFIPINCNQRTWSMHLRFANLVDKPFKCPDRNGIYFVRGTIAGEITKYICKDSQWYFLESKTDTSGRDLHNAYMFNLYKQFSEKEISILLTPFVWKNLNTTCKHQLLMYLYKIESIKGKHRAKLARFKIIGR